MTAVTIATPDGPKVVDAAYQRGVWAVTPAQDNLIDDHPEWAYEVTHAPSGLGACRPFWRWLTMEEATAVVDDLAAAGLERIAEDAVASTESYIGARLFGDRNQAVLDVFRKHKRKVDAS